MKTVKLNFNGESAKKGVFSKCTGTSKTDNTLCFITRVWILGVAPPSKKRLSFWKEGKGIN
jgi:hypothetical protein